MTFDKKQRKARRQKDCLKESYKSRRRHFLTFGLHGDAITSSADNISCSTRRFMVVVRVCISFVSGCALRTRLRPRTRTILGGSCLCLWRCDTRHGKHNRHGVILPPPLRTHCVTVNSFNFKGQPHRSSLIRYHLDSLFVSLHFPLHLGVCQGFSVVTIHQLLLFLQGPKHS